MKRMRGAGEVMIRKKLSKKRKDGNKANARSTVGNNKKKVSKKIE